MLTKLLFLRPSIEGVSLTTENFAFKLLYAISSPFFLGLGVIFYSRLSFNDAINCVTNSSDSYTLLKAMDSYCLENSYVLQDDGKTVQTLGNYQYVGLFFALCSAMTFSTYVFWEWWENGTLNALLQDLSSITLAVEDDSSKLKTQIRALILIIERNHVLFAMYATAIKFCEICHPLILWGIMKLGEEFLGGRSWPSSMSGEENAVTFPKVGHCSWDMGVTVYVGVCTMNLNYLSEKLFVLGRWWLIGCMTISLINLAYRMALLWMPNFRIWILTQSYLDEGFNPLSKYVPLLTQHELSDQDFFILDMIQANVPPVTFAKILDEFITSNPSSLEGN